MSGITDSPNQSGLTVSATESIRSFLLSASKEAHLSHQLRDLASTLISQNHLPYNSLRTLWIGSHPSTRPDLISLLSGSEFIFTSPKPREKSEVLKARLRKLEELAERNTYQELVRDITPRKDENEPFSSYKDQLGFVRILMANYRHLFWTPCAAHCIDLMLEDIGKMPQVKNTVRRAISLNSYIYVRPGVVNMLRKFTGHMEILRPGVTRFATSFLTLERMHTQKNNLRKMFTSDEWTLSKWGTEASRKKVTKIVLMPSFWSSILHILKVYGPLVRVLRLVDGEKKPSMGYIYEAMDRAKEAIAKALDEISEQYKTIKDIIDARWEDQLHQPLHAAGHFLNPAFFYDNPNILQCKEIVNGLYTTILRLVPSHDVQNKISDQLSLYQNAEDLFGNELAVRQRKLKSPGLHVALTMFTGYLVGYAAFRALFGHNPGMSAAGGILGLVFGMLVETLLFMIRTSNRDPRSSNSTLKKNQ